MRLKKYALVCSPADTLDKALRMKDLGDVDVVKAKEQHKIYCRALESLGFHLLPMRKDARYPDSVFVEDPAIVIQDMLIILDYDEMKGGGRRKKSRRSSCHFSRAHACLTSKSRDLLRAVMCSLLTTDYT